MRRRESSRKGCLQEDCLQFRIPVLDVSDFVGWKKNKMRVGFRGSWLLVNLIRHVFEQVAMHATQICCLQSKKPWGFSSLGNLVDCKLCVLEYDVSHPRSFFYS